MEDGGRERGVLKNGQHFKSCECWSGGCMSPKEVTNTLVVGSRVSVDLTTAQSFGMQAVTEQ